jgi:hypothetical protein
MSKRNGFSGLRGAIAKIRREPDFSDHGFAAKKLSSNFVSSGDAFGHFR